MSFHRVCCCNVGLWLPFDTGMDGQVSAVCVYNGSLYAGGNFRNASGNSAVSLARWDGSQWQPVSGGVYFNADPSQGGVNALAVFDGKLYIGGDFDRANGNVANGLASWDGSTLAAVGSGTNDGVDALYAHNSLLYIGGTFTTFNGSSANFIAAWDGSSDVSTDSGALPGVADFAVYSGALYAVNGGNGFTNNVQVLNGSIWSTVPAYAESVLGLLGATADANYLYVTGEQTVVDGASVDGAGRYNGSTWERVGSTLSGLGQDVHLWNSNLVVGGTYAGFNNVARWDGSQWSAFGAGLNNTVICLTTYNGYLVAGGVFTASGANTRNRIAYWSIPETP